MHVLALVLLVAAPQAHSKALKQGDKDPKGRWVLYAVGKTPLVLQDPAGVMIINIGKDPEKTPKAQFVLAQRGSRRLLVTTDEKAFMTALGKVKKGTVCPIYNTCSSDTWFGLLETQARVRSFMEKRGLKEAEAPRITCVCEGS